MTNRVSQKEELVDKNRAENHDKVINEEERIEDKIDRDLDESFPASDAPGWTMGVEKRRPQREKT